MRVVLQLLVIILVFLCKPNQCFAIGKNNIFDSVDGYIDLNSYYDTRNFDVITVNTFVTTKSYLEYFSFINIFGGFNTSDDFRFNKYYTEQDFRLKFGDFPVKLEAQYVTATDFLDLWRFGLRIRVDQIPILKKFFQKLNLIYEPGFYPLQIDKSKGYDAQIEHFYFIQVFPSLFKDRLYISGFLDHNLLFGSDNKSHHNKFVTENQIGFRVYKNLYVILEQRYNKFLPKKKNGLGIGLEYTFKF